jgi:hypothetical protein
MQNRLNKMYLCNPKWALLLAILVSGIYIFGRLERNIRGCQEF